MPQNTGLLVCDTGCLDDLAYQFKLLILPPDPQPFFNTRPENYIVDETNWLTTVDGTIYDTIGGVDYISSIPNPSQNAATSYLLCSIKAPSASLAVAYLDLFNGNPAVGGMSVLLAITGSAARTNIASQITLPLDNLAINTDTITITSASASTTNLSYVGIYNAASGGTLVMSGTVSASPTIASGNPVQFNAEALSIDLN